MYKRQALISYLKHTSTEGAPNSLRLKDCYKSSLSFVDCTGRLWSAVLISGHWICLYPVWKKSEN